MVVEIFAPDGMGEITVDPVACRLFVLNDQEGLSAWASIGPLGLKALAQRLLTLATEMEAMRD